MRWRRREGPWGSHQLLARALKWETSVGSTEECGGVEEDSGAVEEAEERRTGIVGDIGVSRAVWEG